MEEIKDLRKGRLEETEATNEDNKRIRAHFHTLRNSISTLDASLKRSQLDIKRLQSANLNNSSLHRRSDEEEEEGLTMAGKRFGLSKKGGFLGSNPSTSAKTVDEVQSLKTQVKTLNEALARLTDEMIILKESQGAVS